MAFQRTIDLYVDLILPKLADGPRSQLHLDVPRYALEALQRDGLVFMKSHRVGCSGVQMWYPAGAEPLPTSVDIVPRDCAVMTFEGLVASGSGRLD
jgi:hypothetical protein